MPVIKVNPDALKRTNPDEGIYEAVLRQIGEPKPTRYDDKQLEVLWTFTIDMPDNPFHGIDVFENTNIEKGKGDKFLQFCRSLGPAYFVERDGEAEFDTDNVKDLRCRIRTKNTQRKNKTTKEVVTYTNVEEIVEML